MRQPRKQESRKTWIPGQALNDKLHKACAVTKQEREDVETLFEKGEVLKARWPFCGNEKQDEMLYFYAEGEGGVRINRCNRCGMEIKMIDYRQFPGPVMPVLDDLATSHLEIGRGTVVLPPFPP